MWEDRMRMILNEYRLMPWQKEAQELMAQLMEQFFFGEGALVPVYTTVCVIGQPGEEAGTFRPAQAASPASQKVLGTPAAPAAGGGQRIHHQQGWVRRDEQSRGRRC